jgi:hypothetical protein
MRERMDANGRGRRPRPVERLAMRAPHVVAHDFAVELDGDWIHVCSLTRPLSSANDKVGGRRVR